jgi:AcrR family transcriptional regulator
MPLQKKLTKPVAKKKPAAARPRKKTAPRREPPVAAAPPEEDKASAIRHAAFICFSERGYHETSVDVICREAGTSKGAFYWYFQSKEAVFLQILEVWADEVEREVRVQFQRAFEDDDPVNALLAALAREGHRGRRVLPIWLDGLVQSQRNPALRDSLARFMDRLRAALTDVIRPAFAPYHGGAEVDRIAGLLFSCFIGSISQHIVDPGAGHYDEQCRQLLVTTERFATLLKHSR